jgi:hypothetical protein
LTSLVKELIIIPEALKENFSPGPIYFSAALRVYTMAYIVLKKKLLISDTFGL